jgi:hypothetical protein
MTPTSKIREKIAVLSEDLFEVVFGYFVNYPVIGDLPSLPSTRRIQNDAPELRLK